MHVGSLITDAADLKRIKAQYLLDMESVSQSNYSVKNAQ